MTDHFQAIKERVEIVSEIQKRTGLTAKKVGKNLDLSECPFCHGHDCFRIDPDKQLFNCFQCEAGGDVVAFVQKEKACSSSEALQELAASCGYELPKDTSESKRAAIVKEDSSAAIREVAAEYYHANLLNTKSAVHYQTRNRKHRLETIKAFRVGCADKRLHEELQRRGFNRDQILSSGLLREKDGYLHNYFAPGLYIYPHLTTSGQVGHFTIKDPRKKLAYQLPNEFKASDCPFFNMPAFKGREILLVEGENDLLSVYGQGGYHQVAACCGQLSKAQVDYLVKWAPGKIIYLCFDNDQPGHGYVERVTKALEARCLPQTLSKLQKTKATDLRVVCFDPKYKDIDEYLRAQRDPESALHSLLEGAKRVLPPLKKLLRRYSQWVEEEKRHYSYDEVGKICFDWFNARGKFFVDGEVCFVYYDHKIFQIGNNTAFKALMYDLTGLNAASNGYRLVCQSIESQAYLKGDHANVPGWIYTNFKTNTVYFNLCNSRNEILRISPTREQVIPNGTNTERVLLRNPPKMRALGFLPETNVKEGMARLKELFFDNLACDLSDRYFMVCILLNTLLIEYIKARGITKLSGPKGSGKTAAASMISTLIYGADCVTIGSAASDFSEAAVSPLTISDNLEGEAVRGAKKDFLILAATGITRQKRKSGTDSDNIYEKSCTQVLVTSIEPFIEPELIERSNDILFDRLFFSSEYPEAMSIEADIADSRNLIWSAIFKIFSESILPDIHQKRLEALRKLRELYPGHSKSRLNELYAMLYIILGQMVKYIPHEEYIKDSFKRDCQDLAILHDWIENQNARSRDTERSTNKILHRLEALVKEFLFRADTFAKQYGLEVSKQADALGDVQEINFTASTRDLFIAFDWLAKDRGISNPFKDTSQLGARLGDSVNILKDAGWQFQRNIKKVRGDRKHLFTKRVS